MSPNEAQLRAALREGEDDALDRLNADAIIWAARRLQRERRRRVTAIAGGIAAAAIVGLGVSGIVALGGGGGGGKSTEAGGGALSRTGAPADSAGRGGAAAEQPDAVRPREATQLPCPNGPERFLLPGGGGTGQFGGNGPLFSTAVSAMTVCLYPIDGSAITTVLSTAQAAAVAKTLEAAPVVRTPAICPDQQPPSGSVELLAVSPTGVAAKPVVITLGCPTNQVTNGTAVRYPRTLPPALGALVPGAKPAR